VVLLLKADLNIIETLGVQKLEGQSGAELLDRDPKTKIRYHQAAQLSLFRLGLEVLEFAGLQAAGADHSSDAALQDNPPMGRAQACPGQVQRNFAGRLTQASGEVIPS
jgi:hypothetical protein